MTFEQCIAIDNANYLVTVTNKDIIITGEGRIYQKPDHELKDNIRRRLEHGLRRMHNLDFKASLETDSIHIEIFHPLFDTHDKYEIPLVPDDDTNYTILDKRITTIESKEPKYIYITSDEIGPTFIPQAESKMDLSYIKRLFDDSIENKKAIDNFESVKQYYNIKHKFSVEPLFASDAQLIYPGLVIDRILVKQNMCYTVLERKVPLDCVCIITISLGGNSITFEGRYTFTMKKDPIYSSDHTNVHMWKTTFAKFIESGWLCKVNLPDNLYMSSNGDKLLVKNKKLYHIFGSHNLEDNMNVNFGQALIVTYPLANKSFHNYV